MIVTPDIAFSFTILERTPLGRLTPWWLRMGSNMVGPERFELSPVGLKVRCAAITPRSRHGRLELIYRANSKPNDGI